MINKNKMNKIIKITENDLTRIVRKVIKEQMEGNRLIVPDIFTGIIDEVGNITTSNEIISLYNELVSPGDFDNVPQLVGFDSNRDMFVNEEGMNIESYVIFDEINYALTGMEPDEESDEF